MAATVKTLRIPDETRLVIEEMCRRTGRGFSSVANEMLSEAVKMRRIPGIYFMDTVSGRAATISGTGLGVWEIVMSYRDLGHDWEALKSDFHWLSDQQLRAALAYAEAYPEEIDARIARDERWTPEVLWATYPFMRPPWQ